jgi:hypothetical protein
MSVTWLCRKLRQVGEGALGPAPQVSSNRGLADLDAELEQLAVDTGCAPERVGEAHLVDQITDFGTHLGPSGTARSPPPIDAKAFAMPLDHGCRLDQHHGIEDLRPNPVKPNPEKSVRGEEPNPTWVLPTQDAHLMPQANQLELQGGAAAKPEGEDGNDSGQNRNHACDGTAVRPKALDLHSRPSCRGGPRPMRGTMTRTPAKGRSEAGSASSV